MIQSNNNLSVLPWYTKIEYQNHRKNYAFGAIFPLITPLDTMLPFQIMRPTRDNNIVSVKVYNESGVFISDITTQLINGGLQIAKFPSLGYDVIVYPDILPMYINMEIGIHYAEISDGVDTWFSEMFTYTGDVKNCLCITWYDSVNMVFDAGQIVYRNPLFKNKLYLKTEIGKPEYVFEEEGENRDGYFFPEKQISEKRYRFMFLAPEYLCDVMRTIRMSDFVFVEQYGRVYECDTFLITPKWQTQGDLASVEAEFETNTVIKKIGRGVVSGGDFSNDYNDDFKNQ